ncbi:ArsI/CadI family heavy metal resistance metalloenzyme [Alicyclobacillus sendaiensis]|uniref:ArsI/CadI family heavy metal resistance metalloenzyme n=1 Tax=Alicyclobacillus sendaiensis PA2 TaxID=3029425 RepID=A0ABT6XWB1_ALISE|nr:ArsI/CadI family heavy metal resistance metalloenzyme [Alicyclobacillus sendaiensis]MDI9259378.1 ArsI/CadI family heavy metal resistance metalloenzyme [Alicyclobacillus sendaiensis PA2]
MFAWKPHVAINVRNLSESLKFYRVFFGVEPVRVRRGYAKFDLETPPLNFSLNEHAFGEVGALNHLGLQVSSTEEVLAAKTRLEEAGLATFDEMNTTCCYALQDKIWVTDPNGIRWEVFAVLDQEDDRVPGSRILVEKSTETCCTTCPTGSSSSE